MNALDAYLRMTGMNQSELADFLGVSPAIVCLWTRGKQRISAERAVMIEKALGGKLPRWVMRPDLWDPPTQ